MNRIILDELGRRWWLWGLICLSCLLLAACLAADEHFYFAFYPGLLCISTMAMSAQSGRVLFTLPFTARQIGRAVWILNVVIPSLLLALFTGLGILMFTGLVKLPAVSLAAWFKVVVPGSLGFGSVFWVFSGGPLWGKWQNPFWVPLYLWGFLVALVGGGYLLATSAMSDEMKFLILCFFGIVFTVLGWFRVEGLVIAYASYRKETASVSKPEGTFRPRTGYGGVPYLIINRCVRYLGYMGILAVLAFAISVWSNHRIDWHDISGFMKVFRFYFVVFCFWIALTTAFQQKFLRSLPLTSKGLAAVILCLPILPFLILCGIFIPIDIQTAGTPAALSMLKGELLCVASLCVFVIAIAWRDEKKLRRIATNIIVFILSAIPAMYQLTRTSGKQDLPLWIIIAVPLISCFLALYILKRLLERNDLIYRVQMQNFIEPAAARW